MPDVSTFVYLKVEDIRISRIEDRSAWGFLYLKLYVANYVTAVYESSGKRAS